MAKQIIFEHKGKEYCLEYTREAVKQMQRTGIDVENIGNKFMLVLPQLFAGAFIAHHKFDVKQKEIEEIFEHFTNKWALFEKLTEMYNEPLDALMADCDDEKNAIKWEASF